MGRFWREASRGGISWKGIQNCLYILTGFEYDENSF